MYEIKLEQFSGPLEKLLELIEARELEITTVSLAEVTADFVKYAQGLEKTATPAILADFLVVASHLVLIKSKVLLPSLELTQEEKSDIHELEARLKIYREFCAKGASASGGKSAAACISELWGQKRVALSRPLFYSLQRTPVFYAPAEFELNELVSALNRLIVEFQEWLPEATRKIKRTAITLESKINELINRLKEATKHSFKTLIHAKSRQEIVVLFLAILHLLKDRFINVEQNGQFGDIILKKSNEVMK